MMNLKLFTTAVIAICIWVFETREDRNRFMDETVGMMKEERETFFEANYQ